MYKVKRFSVIKVKEFADKSTEFNRCIEYSNKFTTEFIKCMEMYDDSGNLDHWISGCLSNISNLSKDALKYFLPSIILARCVMKDSLLTNSEVKDKIKNLYGSKFIKSIKQSIVSSKKYPSLTSIDKFTYDDEYYSRVLTIFIHVLNKKIDVDSVDTSSIWDYSYDTKKIDLTTDKLKVTLTESELRRMMYRFIYHLNGDSGSLNKSNLVN